VTAPPVEAFSIDAGRRAREARDRAANVRG
jgi:hypothetical protein